MANRIDSFRGPYRWLSNFHMVDVTLDGHVYPSTEHAYQVAKTRDERVRALFRHPDLTCRRAQRLGRLREVTDDWWERKLRVMEDLLRQKFSVPYLRDMLLATGDAELVEGNSWGDTFWGVCDGYGQNHLGRLLMKVREELRCG